MYCSTESESEIRGAIGSRDNDMLAKPEPNIPVPERCAEARYGE